MTGRPDRSRGPTRRRFLTTVLAGTAGVALAACASAPPSPTAAPAQPTQAAAPTQAPAAPTATPAAQKAAATPTAAPAQQAAPAGAKVEVDFWNPATDKLGKKIIAELVDDYNKQSTKITVKDTIVPDESHYAKYTTAIASGQPPGAIMTYEYTPIVEWASQGFVVPLDAYQKSMGIKEEDYFPVAWQMIHFHGHLWGFIQEFDFNILAWNKTLFQKASLDPEKPPKTTDEMDDLAQKLTIKDASGALKQIGFCPWITGSTLMWSACWGGQYYDASSDKWTIVTDANVAALAWFQKYAKLLGGPDKVTTFTKLFTGDQTPFYAEQMAMEAMGEYTPITLPDVAPKLQYGVAYPPTASGVPYGTGQTDGGNVFLLPKGAPHPDESMDFMTYMGGPKAVLKWNVEENNVPPVKAVAFDDNFVKQVPLMKAWIEMLKLDHMVPPATSPVTSFFSDQLATARDEVIYGKKSPKDALTDLAKKVETQVQQFKASHPNW